MQVVEGEYIPDVGLDYPTEDPLSRMLPVKPVREYKNDDTYPYLDDSLKFKLGRIVTYVVVASILRVVLAFKFGLRFEGRENIRKNKEILKGSFISVSNHCFPLDALCLVFAMRRRVYIPMLADLFVSSNWWVLTHFGGIPLTDGTLSATKKFNAAFDELNRRGKWIHVFAEARSWPFYKPLRPFQKGAFTWAYKWNCPILPMNLSYRKRSGIYKLFGPAETPLITVRIGEPILPDTSRGRKEEVDRLLVDTHAAVCKLAGIVNNPWPVQSDAKL